MSTEIFIHFQESISQIGFHHSFSPLPLNPTTTKQQQTTGVFHAWLLEEIPFSPGESFSVFYVLFSDS